jgi:hypothetical protein
MSPDAAVMMSVLVESGEILWFSNEKEKPAVVSRLMNQNDFYRKTANFSKK